MELIINIPEQMYLNSKADMLCGADIIVSAIKNGIPRETVTEFADRCRECGREKVLDKIIAEIEQNAYPIAHGVNNHEKGMTLYGILQIIDKYKQNGRTHDTDKRQ